MMGSKKKHERSKSRKKHKHKKHKKKKDKVNVTDLSDAHESSDFEATASTQEALEQYDRILLALESEKDELKDTIPQEVEAVSDASPQSEPEKRMDAQDANSLTRQPSDVRESSDMLPCSEAEESLKGQSHDKENLQNRDCQMQDRSQSKSRSSSRDGQSKSTDHQSKSESHRSRNRGHRSKSRENQSRSKGYRSRSRGHRSRSRGRRSTSRGRRSTNRDHRSKSRDRRSRSREYRSRNRGHRSRSRDRHSRRRHCRNFSRSSSRAGSRSRERRSRHHYHERRRRRSSSSSSRSRTPKRKTKIVVEKAEPQLGSLESFTTLCQQLVTQVQELPVVNFPVDDNENTISQEQIKAPFNIGTSNTQNLVFHNNAWKTSMQVMTEKVMTSSVAEVFPCSSGTEHHTKELQQTTLGIVETPAPPQEPIDIGALSQRRLQLQQQLQTNPMDIQAYSSYLQVEQQIAEWSNAQKIPGQFTGQKKTASLSGKDLHATGRQAWVKKDMFTGLNPVRSDFGLKMMKKMGWVEGTPLGKAGIGHIAPPVLNFQVDRKGLVSDIDSVKVAPPPNAIKSISQNTPFMFKGKHPVSALQELAAKKQWVVSYEDVAIPGKPGFCFKVTLPLGTFQPTEVSATKKQAKLHAALNCLVGIGALPAEEAQTILKEASSS